MSFTKNLEGEDLRKEISYLLQMNISADQLQQVLQRESIDRINNAAQRTRKREQGAYRFLKNCFTETQKVNGQPQNREVSQAANNQESVPLPEEPLQGSQDESSKKTTKEQYIFQHVYGKKGALCFQADFKGKHNLHTIAVDGAKASGIRQYDWKKKLRIQLTQEELPAFAAVFLGMTPYCKLSNHGSGNNKTLEVKDQGNSLFVQMYGPGQNVAVQIQPSDAFYIAQIIMRQMLLNAPWLDSTGLLNLIRMVVSNRTVQQQPAQYQRQNQG